MQEFKVGSEEFVLPDEISYNQYYKVSELLGKINPDVNVNAMGGDSWMVVTAVLVAMMQLHIIPEFFALIVYRKADEKWKAENIESNKELLKEIGDKTAMEIIKSFLAGRMDLTKSIMDSLGKLKTSQPSQEAQ